MAQKNHGRVLLLLLIIFIFRVLAQLLQASYPVSFLPPFESWHSGSLPYPLLLLSQIIIILVFSRIVWKLFHNLMIPSFRWGKAWLVLGTVYFGMMSFRLIAGLTFAADHSWLGATIPTIFHLDLASFIMIYAHFHYSNGKE